MNSNFFLTENFFWLVILTVLLVIVVYSLIKTLQDKDTTIKKCKPNNHKWTEDYEYAESTFKILDPHCLKCGDRRYKRE